MEQNYKAFIDRVIDKYEGPYGWDKRDPGGPTKFGVTCYDLAAHRHKKMTSMARWAPIVKAMTREEAEEIYKENYAVALKFDALPPGVDCVMLDYGVNSGVTRPIRVARSLLGMSNDVHFTDELLQKIIATDHAKFIDRMCDERLRFMHGIKKGAMWAHFGHGWQARVDDLRKYCHAHQGKTPLPEAPEVLPSHPKAKNENQQTTGTITKGAAGTATTVAAGQHAMNISPSTIIITLLGVIAATFVYNVYQDAKAKRADASVDDPSIPMLQRFIASFEASGTIWLARAKALIGTGIFAVQSSGVDLSTFVSDPKTLALLKIGSAFLMADGVVSEVVRRSGGAFNDKSDA